MVPTLDNNHLLTILLEAEFQTRPRFIAITVLAGPRLRSFHSHDLQLLWQRSGASSTIRRNRAEWIEGERINVSVIAFSVRMVIGELIEPPVVYLTLGLGTINIFR